jgi:uncharacterized repeat protein (TIGR03803 family)
MNASKRLAVAAIGTLAAFAVPSVATTTHVTTKHIGRSGSVETVIYAFKGGTDGSRPESGVIADATGALYGTTIEGGKTLGCNYGCGTVFKLTPSGSKYSKSTLYAFRARQGIYPNGLLLGPTGDLYGTATDGGHNRCFVGCGTAFSLAPAGSHYRNRTLHKFAGGADGDGPLSALAADANGVLYGTTAGGGGSKNCYVSKGLKGCGVVFKLNPSSSGYTESILYAFQGTTDGFAPYGGPLVIDGSGTLYGTTSGGGAHGSGTIYKLTPSASAYALQTLYAFTGGSDGGAPETGVIADAHGALYGATPYGGHAMCQCGVVFKLTPSGRNYVESNLYTFTGGDDGASPSGGLVLAPSGALYGTTFFGGNEKGYCNSRGCGVVYALTPSASGYTQSLLYAFKNGKDGAYPQGSLLLDSIGGYLYGTGGGVVTSDGEVFRITL